MRAEHAHPRGEDRREHRVLGAQRGGARRGGPRQLGGGLVRVRVRVRVRVSVRVRVKVRVRPVPWTRREGAVQLSDVAEAAFTWVAVGVG